MEQQPPGVDRPSAPGAGPEPSSSRPRRFGATRVRPRIEFGQPKSPDPSPHPQEVPPGSPGAPLTPEIVQPGMDEGPRGPSYGGPFGGGADPFAPTSLAGGRVRVYGCSPGCLIISLVVSLILTLLLNGIF